jgi:CubicO group peptidase (beta-lactamase class C family)
MSENRGCRRTESAHPGRARFRDRSRRVGTFIRVEDHGEVWEYASGSAVAGKQVPVDPRSRIRIGSITKTFVATLVMQLVDEGDEGKVTLDDPSSDI